MSDLTSAEQDVEISESALETRVTAHEAKDKATMADLQAQIDALKNGGGNPTVIANLVKLKAKIENFDPTVTTGP